MRKTTLQFDAVIDPTIPTGVAVPIDFPLQSGHVYAMQVEWMIKDNTSTPIGGRYGIAAHLIKAIGDPAHPIISVDGPYAWATWMQGPPGSQIVSDYGDNRLVGCESEIQNAGGVLQFSLIQPAGYPNALNLTCEVTIIDM